MPSSYPKVQADLVLYFDQPVTIETSGNIIPATTYHSGVQFMEPRLTGGPLSPDAYRRKEDNDNAPSGFDEKWTTLFPGIPHRITGFLSVLRAACQAALATDGGCTFDWTSGNVGVRPGLKVDGYVETKERLVARLEGAEDLEARRTMEWLGFVGMGEARYFRG